MRKIFIFNGKSSADYGLTIDGSGAYNAPERDVESLEIPGRNGSLTVDNGRWKNTSVSYKVGLYGPDAPLRMDAIREWLLTADGYRRLEDSYHPESYRMARYSGNVEWDVNLLARCGEVTLEFDCWPQRFLKIGEEPVTVQNGAKLCNPTLCAALPLLDITLTGAAKIQVGGVQMSISGYAGQMLVDCELQDAYKEGVNLNRYIDAPQFPALAAGSTQISWTGGIERLIITPRWWTL